MIELILCMLVDIGLKFYAVPSLPTLGDLEVKVTDLNLLNMLMDKVDTCMLIDIGLRFYAVHHNSPG